MISLRLMKAFDVMTTLVAARKDTAAREIGTKLLIGNFNGYPLSTLFSLRTEF